MTQEGLTVDMYALTREDQQVPPPSPPSCDIYHTVGGVKFLTVGE